MGCQCRPLARQFKIITTLNTARERIGAGRGGGRAGRREGREREGAHRGTGPHAALGRHVKDEHVKDAAQDVAEGVAEGVP